LSHAKHDEELNLDLAASDIQQIEVPLTFDTEFFGLLKDDVSLLDALQTDEQKAMTDEITVLGNQIAKIAIPAKSNKTDLDRWREIFDIYLQAGVFFSTHELDHGSRNSATALRQLQWFQSEIQKRDLPRSFKLVKSKETLEKFTRINLTLLQNLKFQEINRMAITKILKSMQTYPYHETSTHLSQSLTREHRSEQGRHFLD
jgi:E3 ubiquitin-protein ligase BAH